MREETIEKLLSIGLPSEIIEKAYSIYSERLIKDVCEYFIRLGHRYIFAQMFFKTLNDFAGLYPRKDIAKTLKRAKIDYDGGGLRSLDDVFRGEVL